MLIYNPQPNVAHIAHLIGALSGILVALVWQKLKLFRNDTIGRS